MIIDWNFYYILQDIARWVFSYTYNLSKVIDYVELLMRLLQV